MLLLQTYGKGEEANASGWCNSKESSKVRKWRVSPNFLSLLMQWEYKTKERYLVWKEDRKGNFIVKSYYTSLCVETRVDFPTKEIWGLPSSYEIMFSHLGNSMGEDLNHRFVNEEGWTMLIDLVFAKRVMSLLIKFSFTVQWQRYYRCLFYQFLVRNKCF